MPKLSEDRLTAEVTKIAAHAQQLITLRTAAAKKRGARPPAKALGKLAARLESVRLIMSAAVEDLAALTQEG